MQPFMFSLSFYCLLHILYILSDTGFQHIFFLLLIPIVKWCFSFLCWKNNIRDFFFRSISVHWGEIKSGNCWICADCFHVFHWSVLQRYCHVQIFFFSVNVLIEHIAVVCCSEIDLSRCICKSFSFFCSSHSAEIWTCINKHVFS